MKRVSIMILGYVMLLSFIGCEATKGVGKDLENTGENIQETIKKNQ